MIFLGERSRRVKGTGEGSAARLGKGVSIAIVNVQHGGLGAGYFFQKWEFLSDSHSELYIDQYTHEFLIETYNVLSSGCFQISS